MGYKSGRHRERGQVEPEVRVMEEGAVAKGMSFPLKSPEGAQLCQHFDFSLFSDF